MNRDQIKDGEGNTMDIPSHLNDQINIEGGDKVRGGYR